VFDARRVEIAPGVHAAPQRGQIAVTAIVPAQTVAQVVEQPSEITITDADVLRGYVEVPAGSRLRISSNNPAGYFIDFFTRLPIFRSVRVSNSNAARISAPMAARSSSVVSTAATCR